MLILIVIGMTLGQIAHHNSDKAKKERQDQIEIEVKKRLSEQNRDQITLK